MTPLSRLLITATLATAAVVATPGVASADPPRPTSDRSTIDRIEPPADGVELQVVGGDSFLELTVEPGHKVLVPGYTGEPYLRVHPDGTVEHNLRSPATHLNDDRYGDAPTPSDADADAEPVWEQIATDGTYAWHDHRIHWMSPDRPPGRSAGQVIQDWEVPLIVDGQEVVAHGTLTWEKPISPLPWLATALAAAAVTLVAARRSPSALPAVSSLVAAGAAVVVATGETAAMPDSVGASPLPLTIAAVATVAAVLAAAAALTHRRALAAIASLASVAAVIGWGLLRLAVFTQPVLPTTLTPALDRAGTALALGLALGVAISTVRSDALTPTTRTEPPPHR